MVHMEWIENTWFGIWVRESGSIVLYPMIITLHSYGMAMLVGVSAVIDLRLLGFASRVPLASLRRLFLLIRIGFWISLASGIALTIGDAATMLISPIFYIKMLSWSWRSSRFESPSETCSAVPRSAPTCCRRTPGHWPSPRWCSGLVRLPQEG